MKRIVVWFRGDLRVHDHPALHQACQEDAEVFPLFILDPAFLKRSIGSNRNRFLLESLRDLEKSLKSRGSALIYRSGDPTHILRDFCEEISADAVYYIADYTPYSVHRDKSISASLQEAGIEFVAHSGKLVTSSSMKLRTKKGDVHKVFTPYYRAWLDLPRRAIMSAPRTITTPSNIRSDELPPLEDITNHTQLSPNVIKGGESPGRARLHEFINDQVAKYQNASNDLASDTTSRLSAYFHFGCISPREAEDLLPNNDGARAWRRQLAWREFYHYILLHHPTTPDEEYQPKYRSLRWHASKKLLLAWQEGKTGYPAVDAGMRQLLEEGFMHNRARLIVGSFFTKDLWQDWRAGEAHFMTYLVDGDTANNVGNWQWIASVGTDPAPVYRRLYNPTLQAKKFDPTGQYIRRFVPELKNVPDKYLYEPWKMPEPVQRESGCIIGQDYPEPIVDHAEARTFALEQYRSVND